jgi:predicted outer membrane protein
MNDSRSLRAAAVVAAMFLIGCGSGGSEPERGPAATSNLADRGFLNQVPAHHVETIGMARLGQRRAEHPRLRGLARAILDDHERELAQMRRLSRVVRAGTGATMVGPSMTALSLEERHELETTRRFDRLFIDLVVPHLTSAVKTARLELSGGMNPGVRSLARAMIANDQRQIDELQRLRTRWYGGPVPEEFFDPERGEKEEEE